MPPRGALPNTAICATKCDSRLAAHRPPVATAISRILAKALVSSSLYRARIASVARHEIAPYRRSRSIATTCSTSTGSVAGAASVTVGHRSEPVVVELAANLSGDPRQCIRVGGRADCS